MAAQKGEDSKVNSPRPPPPPPPPPPVLEVICKGLGKTSRFAAGTKAGFAVSLINRKLDIGSPFVLHIEAVKDREEPISFGPDAVLVDYGNGWKLQTVTVLDYGEERQGREERQKMRERETRETASKPDISFLYMAKILVAFVMLFVLGAGFTIALENLPKLILFINSFM
ncbi:maltase-glucoamylase, intestinal protein [Salix suchowensis]|nr:maltase-glucoamylase, intestinal protein [Salix suchowensis]